ncbi:ATP-grasp domain-containing protein [Robertkochia flava]|uniref:ATP-grasp domain-containing protein n=1 Tax=Robertkochia flava TaxID=3447986 RepID=UPI001CC94A55|nr:ATP-grasp domain-containing protein [Robertkochia marina]
MNILITSAGKRVSLLQAFQSEASKIDKQISVICCDASPELSAACQMAEISFKVPRLNSDVYIDELLQRCKDHSIKLIIPTIDTELFLLSENRSRFLEEGIIPVISEVNVIGMTRDKRKTHAFFNKHGILTAREYTREQPEFPLFLKPYDGSRSVDIYLIRRKEDLKVKHLNNEKLMFLEYLDHNEYDEFTCDLYYNKNNELSCVVPRKRIEVRDGEVNKGVTSKNEIEVLIREKLANIKGAIGCLTAQFFMHKTSKKIVGIEINARFGGGYPLTYLAGANYPQWIIMEYLMNKEVSNKFDTWEDSLLMLRYDKEVLVHGFRG